MRIGNNLRRLREASRKSQLEVADLLEIDRKTYIHWENDINDVKSEYIPKLAEIFSVEIKDLFSEPKTNIEITQNHYEKDHSFLNGAILIITDKQSIEDLVESLKKNLNK